MRFHLNLLAVMLLAVVYTPTQAQSNKDTLQLSREYSAQKDYVTAIALLENYNATHPNDVNTLQLLASNYYWNGQVGRADSLFGNTITLHPNIVALNLDHARMLYELQRHREAYPLLEIYISEYPNNNEALEYLAFINYWWGEYPTALQYFQRILVLFPEDPTAMGMKDEIELLLQPHLVSEHQYSFDSQPLKSGVSNISIGKYFNPYFNPELKVSWLYFLTDRTQQTPWFELTNKMGLLKNTTHIKATLGYLPGALLESRATGSIRVEQNITNNFSIALSGESRPYFYTLGSLKEPVSFNAVGATALWSQNSGLEIQAFGGRQFFNDDNTIDTYYLWGLSPFFGWKHLYFNLGYSFNYINSIGDHFESELSLDEILSYYKPGSIEGDYNPYFTPHDQNIHSIIGAATYLIKKQLEIQFKGNIAFYAYADIPYLYLNNDPNNTLFIDKGFSQQVKVPFELSLSATYYANKKISLNAGYIYVENFFYMNNTFNLNIDYIF